MDFIFKHFGKFWIAGVLLGLGIWGVIIWAIIGSLSAKGID